MNEFHISASITLNSLEFDKLWLVASRNYMREEPEKSWSESEKKKCIREYMRKLVLDKLSQ